MLGLALVPHGEGAGGTRVVSEVGYGWRSETGGACTAMLEEVGGAQRITFVAIVSGRGGGVWY